ncbi:nuclear pore complex protein NUP54 isoform X2 [Cryptomeria japonica]|uniref:nuclear pore complex protein NUP54 isoform X2 n=1 Tax=Cryptomeria japonica TaxID=3369 RepID=UPI0027DA349C|nr:nuclear pore complex protein NUP54 isoform X2 [Cryptomeria japonica]
MFGGFGGSTGTPAFFTPATAFSLSNPLSPTTFGFGTPSSISASSPSPFASSSRPPPLFGSALPSSQPGFSSSNANTMLGQPPPLFGQPTANAAQSQYGHTTQPTFGQLAPTVPQFTNISQMAPIEPSPFCLPDKDIQAILDSYKREQENSGYGFEHLMFSVIDPSMRVKPVGVSDVMWREAMDKIEGMDSPDRERIWPELVRGFKDLSNRLKLQDEALALDAQRLQATQKNVKLLERHFQVETMPCIQRLRQKEKLIQRRLLRVMRMVEALEGFALFLPSTKEETQLGEKLVALSRQGAELLRRVRTLSSMSRMQDQSGGAATLFPELEKVDDQCLGEMHEVINQQTDAISRLGTLLNKDMRNLQIMKPKETNM